MTGSKAPVSREAIESRIHDGLLATRPDVAGIIVFGSFASGETRRGIDVRVALPGSDGDTRERADTVLTLRNAIALPRVEVIAYSKQCFINGLHDHSPLVLDVAVDGIVLRDRAGLSNEIAAARRCIIPRSSGTAACRWRSSSRRGPRLP